jgi:hypothetical protein
MQGGDVPFDSDGVAMLFYRRKFKEGETVPNFIRIFHEQEKFIVQLKATMPKVSIFCILFYLS